MATADDRPPQPAALQHRRLGPYTLQPLVALDGILIGVTANGETVGFAFGASEEIAAAALARELAQPAPDGPDGADR
jgi:hypothetical protein